VKPYGIIDPARIYQLRNAGTVRPAAGLRFDSAVKAKHCPSIRLRRNLAAITRLHDLRLSISRKVYKMARAMSLRFHNNDHKLIICPHVTISAHAT